MARPRTYDDSTRAALVEAASVAIAQGGAAAISLRSIAAVAGTTTAAVYTLFGNREALVEAVVAEGFRRFAEHLAAAPRTEDPATDLLALGIAYRANALENPHFYQVMFTIPGRETPRLAVSDPTFIVLRDAVAELTGADADDAATRATRLWALSHGLVSLELAGVLPGDADDYEAGYIRALNLAGPGLLEPAPAYQVDP